MSKGRVVSKFKVRKESSLSDLKPSVPSHIIKSYYHSRKQSSATSLAPSLDAPVAIVSSRQTRQGEVKKVNKVVGRSLFNHEIGKEAPFKVELGTKIVSEYCDKHVLSEPFEVKNLNFEKKDNYCKPTSESDNLLSPTRPHSRTNDNSFNLNIG